LKIGAQINESPSLTSRIVVLQLKIAVLSTSFFHITNDHIVSAAIKSVSVQVRVCNHNNNKWSKNFDERLHHGVDYFVGENLL